MTKIALVVSENIQTKLDNNNLYQVYKVDENTSFDAVIKKALADGCKEVLAFASEEFELCGIKPKKCVQTFVTRCHGVAADFYVRQAKNLINAKISFDEMIMTLSMALRNSAYQMMSEYQSYVRQ